MELLLILTYTAICVAIFKLFHIPVNKWTVPTAFLGGVIIIGALFIVMNYNHPYSEVVRQYYATTPIIPDVRGRIIEVPVHENAPVRKGDILYIIDPEPFEAEIRGLEGLLKAAKKELVRTEKLFKEHALSEREFDQALARVEDLQADLDDARLDIEHTVVRAPSDGFVTQLIVRPGMMALPLSFSPVMNIVPKEERVYFGWFRQNSMLRLQQGYEAEVTLDAIPGVIFRGEVAKVLPVIGEGQLKPTADFLRFDQQKNPGRVPVAIKITDPAFDQYVLPGGVFGQAAIYSEHFHHIAMLRRILLRMSAWMNYVFPFH